MFLTTVISLWISQGSSVTQGAIGPLLLGTLASCIYGFCLLFLAPLFFLKSSFLVSIAFISSWLISIVTVIVPMYFFLTWRTRVSSSVTPKQQQKQEKDIKSNVKV
jgi:hypothetical protein